MKVENRFGPPSKIELISGNFDRKADLAFFERVIADLPLTIVWRYDSVLSVRATCYDDRYDKKVYFDIRGKQTHAFSIQGLQSLDASRYKISFYRNIKNKTILAIEDEKEKVTFNF